jgi:hypothetical protein
MSQFVARPQRFTVRLALAATALALGGAALLAQISPGPLSTPHAALEGSANCLSCHRAGKAVDPALCFACHRALGERVAAGRGLHARDDFRACERCHSEHNGRAYRLVDFGAGGEAGFEHARTGWPLAGKHAGLDCRKCHRPDLVGAAVRSAEPKLDPARTFLGLPTACAACHADPHRGTLSATCTDCHDVVAWKNVRFDHARTRYPLTGKHAPVACLACHKQADPAARTLELGQFRGRALPACAECHKDPHAGRLGADCARCHSTAEFRSVPAGDFDHARTAYPLVGKHRTLACASCHPPGRALRVPGFERCETCHRDAHAGQLAGIAGRGACADCHTVDGFVPARYGPADHAASRFPLAGAHRAVPCPACHQPVAPATLPPPFRQSALVRVTRFRFADSACRSCHRDPHRGALDRYAGAQGCAACHSESGWREVKFDHSRSRYPLVGKHLAVPCASCHPRDAAGALALTGRPLDCAGCHRDVHAGQLARASATGPVQDCARCHTVDGFRPAALFDHQRDSQFALDGRHRNVACAKCHPAERVAGAEAPVVRYRPRPRDCAGCHGPGVKSGGAS